MGEEEIKIVKNIAKELEKISLEKGYDKLELAYLIFALAGDLEEVDDTKVKKCYRVISVLDEVIDEGVKDELYDILND